jgi:Domain of unknown function (DUF4112)
MPRQLTSNEHLDYIAALLDDIFRIPGTKIRFGLDALIGWVPGIGDAMAGIASFLIVFAAWHRGVPSIYPTSGMTGARRATLESPPAPSRILDSRRRLARYCD